MFSLFNKNKKIANEIAAATMNTVRLCFATSKYLDERGIFHPPYGFWNDSYIVGFIYGLSGCFLHFDFSGSSIKTEDKGEIIVMVFANMCGNDYRQPMSIANDSALSKQNKDFNLGAAHSSTAYGAMSGRLKENDPDPLLAQAKVLAKQQHDINIEMSGVLGISAASTNSSIGAAVIELTIMNHIKNKYLQAI